MGDIDSPKWDVLQQLSQELRLPISFDFWINIAFIFGTINILT